MCTIQHPTEAPYFHSTHRIIKKRAADASVEGFISWHSLRVGSAVSLAQAGATVVDMQVAGNLHKCPHTTLKHNSLSGAQSHDSRTESDK